MATSPVLNIAEIAEFEHIQDRNFEERYAPISEAIGAVKLGYSLAKVPPGKKSCPFHNHRIAEEMFLVLSGEGTLRFGDKEYPVRAMDVIACPPGDSQVAHQIINTGSKELVYFCLGTNEQYDICEYPDSEKIMAFGGSDNSELKHTRLRHMTKRSANLDYMTDES